MAADPAERLDAPPLSAIELAHAAPHNRNGEVLGEIVMMSPRPRGDHAGAATTLTALVTGAFMLGRGGPGGWVVLHEPELHLGAGPDVLVPDVAAWRRARMPTRPNVAAFTLAPDWICEVLSPGTEVADRGLKMPIYAREGVAHAWLVDAEHRTLEAFRNDSGTLRALGVWRNDGRVRAAPFEDVELELALLWMR